MLMRRRAAQRLRGTRTPRRPEMAALLRAISARRKMTAGSEDAPRRETTMHHKSPTSRGARPALAARRGQHDRAAQPAGLVAPRVVPRDRRAFIANGTSDPSIRLLHARARARRAQLEHRRAVAIEQAALAANSASAQTPPDLSTQGLILYALDAYEGLVAEAQASLACAVHEPAHDAAHDNERDTRHLHAVHARIALAREACGALALRVESFAQDAPSPHDALLRDVVGPALAYCLESIETESEMLIVTRLGTRALRLGDTRIAGLRAHLYPQYRPMARIAAALRGSAPSVT